MTCREFKHSAATFTLWELGHAQDDSMLKHAAHCESCGAWLGKQRSLAASLRTLQTESAGLQAGPRVEQALLNEFRRTAAARTALAPAVTSRRSESEDADRFTPLAMRLSRFFEIGAYAAAAAAIMVGIFLGAQLLHHFQTTSSQAASGSASVTPMVQKPPVARPNELAKKTVPGTVQQPALLRSGTQRPASRAARPASAAVPSGVAEASPTNVDGYIALMFCDPLSCSSDSEVVRMEWPAPEGQSAQPQVADVVVGDDGVVRAVRIVN